MDLRPFVTVERRPDGVALDPPRPPQGQRALRRRAGADLRRGPATLTTIRPGRSCCGAGAGSSPPGPTSSSWTGRGRGRRGELHQRARRPGRHPPGHHRRHQRVRARAEGWSWHWPATSASAPKTPSLGLPEVLLGVIPGGGGTQRLPAADRVVAGQGAHLLRAPGARPRRRWPSGLVNRVVAPDDVLEAALAWAADIRPRRRWWPTVWPSRPSIGASEGTLADGLALEQEAFAAVARTEDAARGIASFAGTVPARRPSWAVTR